ncbi:replication protein [Veillonella criceti]|jgi:hypothetical protein|uniref:Replication protein repB n=1 Tax=Veillonella criceti TaxID=103891 RepID=A0A380Q0Z5_9FIRM|nr:replication protein [Veillonella criceti]SUP79500.1 Replication protein repB [Veillonella criceti]SUP79501.1 Replication protein repB [Veillonella criceti]
MATNSKEKQREYDAKRAEKRAGTRTRNYATVVYPESAPADWKNKLEQTFIPCLISPLHDKDINPGGEPKKPHYHVLLAFEGVKTKAQAQEVFDTIGGVGCEVVNSVRGYARYLCHLDNPEKARYAESQVTQYGGLDYYDVIGLASDKHKAIREMIEYCKDTGVIEYADLLEYAMYEREDWFRVLCDCGTFTMQNYLKSRRHKLMAKA